MLRRLALLVVLASCAPRASVRPFDLEAAIAAHPVQLAGDMDEDSVAAVELALAAEKAAGRPAVLVIDSPGGVAASGVELHDWLRAQGDVTCVVTHEAASAAFLALQGCAVRIALPGASLMIHRPYLLVPASLEPRPVSIEHLRELLADLLEIDSHMVGDCARAMRMSEAALRERLALGDWEMTADEAYAARAVDRIASLNLPASVVGEVIPLGGLP